MQVPGKVEKRNHKIDKIITGHNLTKLFHFPHLIYFLMIILK